MGPLPRLCARLCCCCPSQLLGLASALAACDITGKLLQKTLQGWPAWLWLSRGGLLGHAGYAHHDQADTCTITQWERMLAKMPRQEGAGATQPVLMVT